MKLKKIWKCTKCDTRYKMLGGNKMESPKKCDICGAKYFK